MGQSTKGLAQRSANLSASHSVIYRTRSLRATQRPQCLCRSSQACGCGAQSPASQACSTRQTQAAPSRQGPGPHARAAAKKHSQVASRLQSVADAAAPTEPGAPVDHQDAASSPSAAAASFAPMTWPSRSHSCGQITQADVGRTVTLCGWVDKNRDMGALQFFDMRDHTGLVQASSLRFENLQRGFTPGFDFCWQCL